MAEERDQDAQRGQSKRLSQELFGKFLFNDAPLERMYQSYRLKQKRGGLKTFLLAAFCLNAFVGFVRGYAPVAWCAIAGAFLALVLYAMEMNEKGKFKCGGRSTAFFGWVSAVLVLPANPPPFCPMAIIFLLMVALPLRLRYCMLLTFITAVCYELISIFTIAHDSDYLRIHYINILLMFIGLGMGLLGFIMDDSQQRLAFLETRQSLEVKLVIEEQSAEQERLLLSVLPEHVAVRMRQDLGSTDTQFKKIYMSRHENVSILYADIVGFTAISSTYSAQDLVAILNELFARFDRLAEKYHQLRIKILGDCYYCISGAPVETPDHAALCVRMGLAMVKSIKYLQQTTNSPVDMRVGIHTGAVLAGVLGQRQWQFDVYSRDVELANKMESSGNAGRVHISEKTLSFLNGEFEVEPAYGEKREEALRLAGIKTYFIVKVLKPFGNEGKSGDGDAVTNSSNKAGDNGKAVLNNVSKKEEGNETAEVLVDVPSDTKDEGDSIKSPVDEEMGGLGGNKKEDSDEFNKRLRKELVKRDGNKLLAKHTDIFLTFRTPEMEAAYKKRGGIKGASSAPTAISNMFPITFVLVFFPLAGLSYDGLITTITVFILLLVITVPPLLLIDKGANRTGCAKMCAISPVMRLFPPIGVVIVMTFHNFVYMIMCRYEETVLPDECTLGCAISGCSAGIILAAFSVLTPLSFLGRSGLALFAAVPAAIFAYIELGYRSDCYDIATNSTLLIPTKHYLYLLVGIISIALIVLSNHLESTSRVLFLWKGQIEEQRERAADMRRRNEALVYNILPPHVAVHFMGNKRRQHHELYSQSYSEVGVLFASMPNFAEFYSEETVNNQGLECLRFLNEVISDFDALLEREPFQDIIKIKTIGSSYMAATGLNPSRHVKADDPITVRWFHLSLLVEFALELKQALQCINEQSFNHFVLKMGINHGPITAGVIGARKPHYDIWGNTVNVASRMESTGKAGCIQVTEDTCNILKHYGYTFEQRGLVSVKGKGQLLTYYLLGKGGDKTDPKLDNPEWPAEPHNEQPKAIELPDVNFNQQQALPMSNGAPKSPNSVTMLNYNGVAPMSPSCKESVTNDAVKNIENPKLIPQDDSCNDLSINARESDALLKN